MERIHTQNVSSAIKVKNNFYTLTNITDDIFDFDFDYYINQPFAIQNNLTSVKIKVFYSQQKEVSIVRNKNSSQTKNEEIIDGILDQSVRTRLENRNNVKNVASSKFSDFTSKFNNSTISSLRSKTPSSEISGLRTNRITISTATAASNNKNSVVSTTNTETLLSNKVSAKRESYELIGRRLDPSNISSKTSNFLHSARDNFLGLSKNSSNRNDSYSSLSNSLVDFVLKDNVLNIDNDFFEKYENVVNDEILIKTKMKFSIPQTVKNIFVEFHLVDVCGSTKQIIRKQIDIEKIKNEYFTPIIPPKLSITRNAFNSSLEIKQDDKVSNSIHLYKKTFDITSENPFFSSYNFLGEYEVKHGETIRINVDSAYENPVLYRAIPVCNNIKGSIFSNAISSTRRYRHTKFVKLVSKLYENSILLEARNIPYDAISFLFLYRNLKNKHYEYTEIDTPVLITDQNRTTNYVSKSVTNLDPNEIYEFSVKAYYKDGTTEILDKEIFEYIRQNSSFVNIKTDNLSIDYNDEDVSFNVFLDIKDENFDHLKRLLENQGLSDIFDKEIRAERENIKKSLAYKVERINLQTGVKENLGIHVEEKFSDKESSFKNGSLLIEKGNSYRYIISAIIRDTETLFEKFLKKETDTITKKGYQLSPFRSRNPLVLTKGTIYTPQGMRTLQAKSDLELGETGSVFVFDVLYSDPFYEISNAKVVNTNNQKNTITWSTTGQNNLIDHFVIAINKYNQTYVLGTCHNNFDNIFYQWTHILTPDDLGTFNYSIIPVLNDYSLGVEVKTNSTTIAP